jgi:hypothetical protein
MFNCLNIFKNNNQFREGINVPDADKGSEIEDD